jgi:hypothetical protein
MATATAPPYDDVTWQQYHRKQIEMAIRNKATPSIQAVANELNISFIEASRHQEYIDKIKQEAHDDYLEFKKKDFYANADIPAAALVYHRHLLTLAIRDKTTPTIKQVATAMGISETRGAQLQSYINKIKQDA